MSDPTKPKLDWGEVWRVNIRFVAAGLALLYGWFCWSLGAREYWGFWLIGAFCLFGGAMQLIAALFRVGVLIVNHQSWRAFGHKGVQPRADKLANEKDVLNGGRE
jgi:hypothetical protein